jgi:hypothetical protein
VLLIFAFKNGIKLNNLSFSDVNVSQLYLKYDKKLFLQIDDLNYGGKQLDLNLTIEKNDTDFVIDFENFVYKNLQMNFQGKLLIPKNKILSLVQGREKNLVFEDVAVVFDQNLSPVLAKKLFVQLEEDIHLRFTSPTLDGVELDNSTISIIDLAKGGVLKVDLYINHMLDLTVLKVLGNYEVELPLKQIGGETHTNVKIDIPFTQGLGTVIYAVANVKNGVISVGDNNIKIKRTPPNKDSKTKVKVVVKLENNTILLNEYTIKSNLLDVVYEDGTTKVVSQKNSVKALGTQINLDNLNVKLKDKKLSYGVDIKDQKANFISVVGDTNLKSQLTQGNLFINHINYENKVMMNSQKFSFEVQHKPLKVSLDGDFGVSLQMENNQTHPISFENFLFQFKNNTATIDTNIVEKNNTATLKHITNLNKNISNGTLFITQFNHNETIQIENQTVDYTVEHKPLVAKITGDIEFLLKNKEKNQDKKIRFEKLIARYENNEATIDTNIIENKNFATLNHTSYLDKNISNGTLFVNYGEFEDILKMENQKFQYEVKNDTLWTHITSDLLLTLKDKKTILKDFDMVYDNNIINIRTNYEEGNTTAFLTNSTNLDAKTSKGIVDLKTFTLEPYLDLKKEFFQYYVDFAQGVIVTIPKYLLSFTKEEDGKQTLVVGKANTLLSKVNHIQNKNLEDGTLFVSSNNDFKKIDIIGSDLGVDINITLFQSDKKKGVETNTTKTETSKGELPKVSLSLFNTKVSVDGRDLNSTSIFGKVDKENITVNYLPENEKNEIKFSKSGDILSLKGTELSDRFMTSLMKKDIFDKGTFSFDIDGNKTNIYGGVFVRGTTVKNVRLLNNLISFVNTTPAIINPLLVLPTLVRMSETNFDMNGYLIKDGYVKFDYGYETKMLTLPSFYTKSKMMDFKGRGNIDIGKETLHLPIDIIFLKDYSKFINHIPIIGYIFTGEDGNFVTNIDIRGTFETQEFETHTVKNASDGVVNVIKRIISVPFMPFMDDKKKADENSTKQNTTNTTNEGN